MFILHSANKTENLVEHLVAVLKHDPLSSPFSKELFVIQSQGLERWLSQQLAGKCAVWANYEFLFPWKFFALITESLASSCNTTAFERNQLVWRLDSLLRQLDQAEYALLSHYLTGTNQALKRFQLAKHLAQIFDQYQIMRPDLLKAWQNHKLLYGSDTEHWQQTLWQKLTEQIKQPNRGERWLQLIATLNIAEEGSFSSQLPERVSIFGINTMPPLFLGYLQSLSRHCQIHLYLLNPAQIYWADLIGKHKASLEDDVSGHPLLRSLGQQGREFQELLLEFNQFDYQPESFVAQENPNNLQYVQNDILDNAVTGRRLHKDSSLSIHACHSRKREVEVLKDQLLMALESDLTLALGEIVVMAPDIQLYEPYISAIFHDIQHSIADRSVRQENRILDVFIKFLELSQSRLGWQSVLDLLAYPEVYPAFGLSETDLELISYWVHETNIRWGQSGEHKQELDLPALDENTWTAALDRLLMGYAVGDDECFVLDVLPYKNIEGSSTVALGGLHDFLQFLFKAKADFKQVKSLAAWGKQFSYFAEQLFSHAEPLVRQPLNELLLELSAVYAKFHHDTVELDVIKQWLEGMVNERVSVNGFLRGHLTFCSMIPMRAIPFKVIALMGINQGEFPKIDRLPTFDLISQHFRKGDRSRRADDRYQFLEILLSARQQLIISYIGQSPATNEVIPPSVVISELLDVLTEFYQLTDLLTQHPLQAFSPTYFDASTANLFSFADNQCAIAQALAKPKPEPQIWWQGSLPIEFEEVIEINELLIFFQHPQRYFLRQQLGLRLSGINAEIEEREPFSMQDLPAYHIHEQWLEQLLQDKTMAVDVLKARGQWLAGARGDLEFERQQAALADFVNRIKALELGSTLDNLIIDSKIGQYRLIGKLGQRYQHGTLLYRYANLKGKDFINAWLTHLIMSLNAPQTTYLLSTDESCIFQNSSTQIDDLTKWLDIFQQGKANPNAFFTEAALVYAQQAANAKAKKSPMEAAIDSIAKAMEYDLDVKQLYGNSDLTIVLSESFAQHCEALLLPVWQAARGN